MNKQKAIFIAAGAAGLLFADGNSASASASVGVRIVAPVKIAAIQHLNFGSIIVDDLRHPSSLTMAFNGCLPGASGNLTGDLASTTLTNFGNCKPYPKGPTHTPALFHFQKDAWVASMRNLGGTGLFDTDVTVTWDRNVTLTGGAGGPVALAVASDLPADPFAPAGAVPGVIYRRFQLAGTLSIPAEAFGTKTGIINVSVSYN